MSTEEKKDFSVAFVGVGYNDLKSALADKGLKTKSLPISHLPRTKLKDVDIIHGFFFHSSWPWFIKGKLKGKKTICFWLGSDSLLASKNWFRKLQLRFVKKFIDLHIVVSDRIKDELEILSIESITMANCPEVNIVEIPNPDKFAIISYSVENREILYGLDKIVELCEIFPEIDFYIVGMDKPKLNDFIDEYSNLHFCGYVDMDAMWTKISLLIRFTQHDGFPRMIIEALAKGKHVIHNFPLPGVIYCKNMKEMEEKINELKTENKTNSNGLDIVQNNFSFQEFVEEFSNIYDRLLSKN